MYILTVVEILKPCSFSACSYSFNSIALLNFCFYINFVNHCHSRHVEISIIANVILIRYCIYITLVNMCTLCWVIWGQNLGPHFIVHSRGHIFDSQTPGQFIRLAHLWASADMSSVLHFVILALLFLPLIQECCIFRGMFMLLKGGILKLP